MMPTITIDEKKIELVDESETILQVALKAGIYIPHLCYHPQLNPLSEPRSLKKVYQGGVAHSGEEGEGFEGCNLCLVEIQGQEGLFQSCKTMAEDEMIVCTEPCQWRRDCHSKNITELAKVFISNLKLCVKRII